MTLPVLVSDLEKLHALLLELPMRAAEAPVGLLRQIFQHGQNAKQQALDTANVPVSGDLTINGDAATVPPEPVAQ